MFKSRMSLLSLPVIRLRLRSRSLIVFLALLSVQIGPSVTYGAIHATDSVQIFGGSQSETGDFFAAAQKSEVIDPDGVDTDAAAAFSGGTPGGHLALRAYASATGTGGATAVATWNDTLILQQSPGFYPVLASHLLFEFSVNGSFATSPQLSAQPALLGGYPTATAQLSFSEPGFSEVAVAGDAWYRGDTGPFEVLDYGNITHGLLDVEIPYDQQDTITFSASLFVQAFGIGGSAEADFSHTAILTAILFPDGSTPESNGYTLTFDSGLTSPNLAAPAATPEPASLVLWSLGALGLAVYSGRRRISAVQSQPMD